MLGLNLGRVGPAVPVPPGEGTALAGDAAAEHQEEDDSRDDWNQDVEPPLRLQLGSAPGQATEEQHVLIPFRSGQIISGNTDFI